MPLGSDAMFENFSATAVAAAGFVKHPRICLPDGFEPFFSLRGPSPGFRWTMTHVRLALRPEPRVKVTLRCLPRIVWLTVYTVHPTKIGMQV